MSPTITIPRDWLNGLIEHANLVLNAQNKEVKQLNNAMNLLIGYISSAEILLKDNKE